MDCPCFTSGTRIALSLASSPSVARIPLRDSDIFSVACLWASNASYTVLVSVHFFHFTASVAYIWWFKTVGTYFLFKVFTVAVAYEFTLFADGYQRMPAVICTTYFFPPACFSVLAGIVGNFHNRCPVRWNSCGFPL